MLTQVPNEKYVLFTYMWYILVNSQTHPCAAASNAVIPCSFFMLMSAFPSSINAFTTPWFFPPPVSAAKCKAVAPHLALAFTFALCFNRYLKMKYYGLIA